MKKKLLVIALAALCLAFAAVGTVAFFTAEETAHNVITTGGIDVTLNEWAGEGEDSAKIPFEDVTGVMPGASVPKVVEVENIGASDAWVRVKVSTGIELAEGVEGEVDLSLVTIDFNTTDWTEQDGWYYYNKPLKPGESTVPLFTCVSFDKTMGNLYQMSTATVKVDVQAVQTANNGSAATDAAGWSAEGAE